MPQTPAFKDRHASVGREMQKFWTDRALWVLVSVRKDVVDPEWQAYRSPSVEQAMSDDKNFDRLTLENALAELGRRAFAAGRTVEIVVYGGSALLLTLNRQINTGDVDAVFEGNKDFIKRLATEMAEEFGWDENWLNDGVKGWLSKRDADPDVKALFKTYPTEDQPGLRVYTARPEYLFAMKCRAMRVGGVETNSDIDDIKLMPTR